MPLDKFGHNLAVSRDKLTRLLIMNRSQNQILQEIESFYPTSDGNWLGLESLLAELWETDISQACLKTLFHVFEKFPEDDGVGVFWSIVHGVESTDLEYASALRQSLERQPSAFGELMVNRLKEAR